MVLYYDRSTDHPATELHDDLVPLRWPYLAVIDIDGKGRGVITTRDLPQGALIERAPVLIIPEHHRPLADKTVVFKYLFMWEHNRRQSELAAGTGRAAIALGVTSLVNHSEHPNAAFRRRIDAQEIELRAICDIESGEEIVIDYGMALRFTPAERAA
ncbi:MAG TPA: SET domain-containing protein-lysine N-methyltransferase [Alphaproteobacteria bacterium]|nr:SET domain-containing protein-lysine N-methyltransferase [Alphaproteobacteria bacterium]